jgi:aryl-alcohol dehydrogenase-like predicted oxidoreductase
MISLKTIAVLSTLAALIHNGVFETVVMVEALSTPTSKTASQQRIDLGTLKISPMGYGTLNLPLDKMEGDEDTVQVIKAAHAAGVNFVDTAEAYGFGRSESLTRWAVNQAGLTVGQLEGGQDDKNIAVATKFAPVPWRPGAESVLDACRASNERLGVDACDLYQSKLWTASF